MLFFFSLPAVSFIFFLLFRFYSYTYENCHTFLSFCIFSFFFYFSTSFNDTFSSFSIFLRCILFVHSSFHLLLRCYLHPFSPPFIFFFFPATLFFLRFSPMLWTSPIFSSLAFFYLIIHLWPLSTSNDLCAHHFK